MKEKIGQPVEHCPCGRPYVGIACHTAEAAAALVQEMADTVVTGLGRQALIDFMLRQHAFIKTHCAEERKPMSKISELVEGIKTARDAGLKDVEAKLKKRLDTELGREPDADLLAEYDGGAAATGQPSKFSQQQEQVFRENHQPTMRNGSGWIGQPGGQDLGGGLGDAGTASPEGLDIPKRSRAEIARAAAYFNEGEARMTEDEERLQTIFDGACGEDGAGLVDVENPLLDAPGRFERDPDGFDDL